LAEYYQTQENEPVDTRDQFEDGLATLIRNKYEDARDFRMSIEMDRWLPAEDAYNGIYVDSLTKNSGSNPPYMNLTRREVTSAHIKINGMLFQNNKIPFTIKPSRQPRFVPSDIHQMAEQMPQMTDKERTLYIEELSKHLPLHEIFRDRAKNMEDRIRDILDQTNFTTEIGKAVHEMCLHGTGVLKSPVLVHRNYPVYSGKYKGRLENIETAVESVQIPSAKFVSIFNLYPSPEATSYEDLSYIVEKTSLSSVQVRQLLTDQNGYSQEAVLDVLSNRKINKVSDLPRPINPHQESFQDYEKEYELLEFWGILDKEDLEGYIDADVMDEGSILPVCITVLGDRVVKAVQNPYDGIIPYHFSYWHDNTHSIWGDGIYWSIRDLQSLINFTMAMYVEGKELSSVPMVGVDASQLAPNEDPTDLYPGKVFQFAPGADVGGAFRPVIIPDVTNGLMELMQFLQREANLASGQSPIGMGQTASYQTRTATGMSLLNSNQNRATAAVVQSISEMMKNALDGIYRWILVDTDDPELHCDAEALCTGYERYIAEEVHNQQLLQFMQVLQQLPQLAQEMRIERLAKPILNAFNLEPDELLKTPEEKQQDQQSQMQQVQMQLQLEGQKEKQKGQVEEALKRLDAALEERNSIGKQRRDLEIQRVLKMMDMGQPVQPSDFSDLSILLKEEQQQISKMRAQQQLEQEQAQAEKDAQLVNVLEEMRSEQLAAQQRPEVSNNGRGNGSTQRPETMASPTGGTPNSNSGGNQPTQDARDPRRVAAA
jgi:hypothetical protein